MSEFVRSIHVT